MNESKLTAPAASAWVDGKTHRGTDGETVARRRVIDDRVELEIKDGAGWLRCANDGYFTPNVPDQLRRQPDNASGGFTPHLQCPFRS